MKGKYIGILLVILNIALLGSIGYLYYRQDHASPNIKVEETTLVYEEGMEETRLLEGVTAVDNVDGDVTAQIIIEKIVPDTRKEKATITYGVVDSSGNISKATRTVAMKIAEEAPEVLVEEDTEETVVQEEVTTEERNGDEGENSTVDNKTQQSTEAEQTNKTKQATEAEQTNKTGQATESKQTNKTTKSVQTNKSETSNKPAQTTKPAQASGQTTVSTQGPSIKLRDNKLKIAVGGKPAWVNIMEGLYDDKDDYVTLFKTIKVSGNYDKNKPGTYKVQVTVTDSDGNVSNAYPVEIIVVE